MTEPTTPMGDPAHAAAHWEYWAEEWPDAWIASEIGTLEANPRRTPVQQAKLAGYRNVLARRRAALGGLNNG